MVKKKTEAPSRISGSMILRKIARVRQLHPNPDEQDKATIEGYEERYNFIMARAELTQNPAIQTLIGEFKREIGEINDQLLNKQEPMENEERQRLLNRRDLCQKHLLYYEAEGQLEALEKEVDDQITFLTSHS